MITLANGLNRSNPTIAPLVSFGEVLRLMIAAAWME